MLYSRKIMLGFACKINSEFDTPDPKLNLKGTTLTWLRANPTKARQKLEMLLEHNISVLKQQLKFVAMLPKQQRMFRISSDLLPAYTTDEFMPFYYSHNNQNFLEEQLGKIGDYARDNNIRLSFHPGQFCVLASESPLTVENSLAEFEYHADIIRWLGYGKKFQDFKCNIHIGGKLGPEGIRKAYGLLSQVARNTITIENQEFTWGLEHCLQLADILPVVFDIHHDWIYTGKYRQLSNSQIQQVIDSWRGVRPTMHYSLSRVLEDDCVQGLDDRTAYANTKQALRAHSDFAYNNDVNNLVFEYHEHFDVMLGAKEKNRAQQQLIDYWVDKFRFDPKS